MVTIGAPDDAKSDTNAKPGPEEAGQGLSQALGQPLGLGGKGIGLGRDTSDAEGPSLLARRRGAAAEGEAGGGMGKGPAIRLDVAFAALSSAPSTGPNSLGASTLGANSLGPSLGPSSAVPPTAVCKPHSKLNAKSLVPSTTPACNTSITAATPVTPVLNYT